MNAPCGCLAPYYGPPLTTACLGSTYLVFMTLVDNLIRNACEISEICERVTPREQPGEEYDFIVIGSGSGGATAAGRLSEVSDWRILLLEAGIEEPAAAQVPSYTMVFDFQNITDWNYKTEPEPVACQGEDEKRCSWSRAKMLGGCTVSNGMMYMRGTPIDYDRWEENGNEGWSYEDVLPWFKYSEDNVQIDTIVDRKYHGTGGPFTVSRFNYKSEMVDDLLKAGEEIGFPVSHDLNGEYITGFSLVQANVRDGVRVSSARAYLRPARLQSNLDVMLNSTVTKILINKTTKTAEGVEFVYREKTYTVKANKEVVLSAGSINSPQLLLLSGVGPKEELDKVGIDQIHELPGVGRNLTNHVAFGLSHLTNLPNINTLDWVSLMDYIDHREGPLTTTGITQVTARLNSKYADPSGLDPDLQLLFGGNDRQSCSTNGEVGGFQHPDDTDEKRNIMMAVINMHTKSKGYIGLKSNNPFDAPLMVGNYLTAPEDIEVLLDGIRIIQKLASSEAMGSKYELKFENTTYGNCIDLYEYDSDNYWRCAIKYATGPENHQSSTCRMGPVSDEFAVVDNELRVYGIKGLRILDASVMPKVVSGNIHATIVMMAERGVDFIKKTWL